MRGGIKYDLWLPPEVESRDRHIASFLHALANDKTRICWPSLPTLVRVDGRSESNVRQTLKRLVELEIIEVVSVGSGSKSTRYRIVRGPGFDFRGCLLADTQGAYRQTPKIEEGSSRRCVANGPATSAPGSMQGYSAGIILAAEYNRMAAEAGMPDFNILTATADRLAAEDAAREAYAKAHPDAEPDIPF